MTTSDKSKAAAKGKDDGAQKDDGAPAPGVQEQIEKRREARSVEGQQDAAREKAEASAKADGVKPGGDVISSGGDSAVPSASQEKGSDASRAGGSAPAGASGAPAPPAPDGPHGDDPTRTADSAAGTRSDTPEEIARSRSAAAPLEAPEGGVERNPQPNLVGAAAALRTGPGEQHGGLVGEDGKDLSGGDLFEDPGAEFTFVTVKDRIYERFAGRNQQTQQTRLLYPKGARVSRARAEALRVGLEQGGKPKEAAGSK